jgi:hypothetical protein
MWEIEIPEGATALGYKKLSEIFKLGSVSHYRWSYASTKWEKCEYHFNDQNLTLYIYPYSYAIGEDIFEHLEFALKNEGINLYILKKVLNQVKETEITTYIQNRPTGKYARILWYLYEKFNNRALAINDLKQGSYIPVLDPKQYYCSSKPKRNSRYRVADNLLGNLNFACLVRKTPILKEYEQRKIDQVAIELTLAYDPVVLSRAMTYLYTKETMSSWEIEREKPSTDKLAKFVSLLHKADSIGTLTEEKLVDLQKNIVDSRFASHSYRDFQNYVGEEPGMGQMIIHYICPSPKDVRDLMNDLLFSFKIIEESQINPVVAAAILSFLFVFIHPFEDGNGRIHRFLIHYVLSRLKFTPEGVVFPISAAIMRDAKSYDKVLETFSKPLMELITEYSINESGEMIVGQDTKDFYKYIDLTRQAEYLYECVDKTIAIDFKEELVFLTNYYKIKTLCKDIVDIPDQKLDLFIKCVRQNNGKLSLKKREDYFNMLTDEEIKKMEDVINQRALPS